MPVVEDPFPRRLRFPTYPLFHFIASVMVAGILLVGCAAQSSGEVTKATPTATPGVRLLIDANVATVAVPANFHFVVVALDPQSGQLVWRSSLEVPPGQTITTTSEPVLEGGLVFVTAFISTTSSGLQHGYLEALDPRTGEIRWHHQAGTELSGMPVVTGGVVYLNSSVIYTTGGQTSETGLAEALDSATGAVMWHHDLDGVPSTPAVAGGRVLILTNGEAQGGFSGAHLVALNSSDGTVAWDNFSGSSLARGADTENGGSDSPILAGSHVFVQTAVRGPDGGAQLTQLAFNKQDGSSAWQYPTGGIAASPVLNQTGDTLCSSEYSHPTSTIRGLSTTSGKPRWTIQLDQAIASGCVAQANTFYVDISNWSYTSGSILALNSRTGQRIWETSIRAPFDADGLLPPAVFGSLVAAYTFPTKQVGTIQGGVAVVDASTGRLVWQRDFPTHPSSLLDISGDRFYLWEDNVQGQQMLVACALATGNVLWSYGLGHV